MNATHVPPIQYDPARRISPFISENTRLARLVAVRRFEIYNLRLRSSGKDFVTAEFRIESDAVDSGIAGWYQLELRAIGDQWKIHGEAKVQPLSRVAPRN